MQFANWRNFDWLYFIVALALVAVGIVMIYSAYEASLPQTGKPLMENAVFRQGLFAAIGIVVYALVATLDYHALVTRYRWGYLLGLAMLVITVIIGDASFGAQSWIRFEGFDVQASELCKVIVILVMANILSGDRLSLDSPVPLLLSLALLVPLVVLIYLQPDFGTAMVVVAIWMGTVALSGVRWQHLLLLGLAGAGAAPLIWFRLESYMHQRILMFFYPANDLTGASYNINQALISIGSGGWWGKGLLNGTQSQLYFLRVRHTDFIFSVLAEELGFIGAFLFLLLFLFLILRSVRIALQAPDNAGRLIASGVAVMLAVQTIVNVGMNANILPVTGLPLPLVSYGGNSLTTTLLALGLVQGVAMRRKSPEPPLIPL
jgi:rod shape determining protein RodA